MFGFEKEFLKNSGNNYVAIHHVGSSSFWRLATKPKIDVIAVVKNRKFTISNLEKSGYLYKGEWKIPLQCGFTE